MQLLSGQNLAISVITEIELLSYHALKEDDERVLSEMIKEFDVIPLTDRVKSNTIQLRKKYRLKTPDAIVAATALTYNLTLVTADKKMRSVLDIDIVEF